MAVYFLYGRHHSRVQLGVPVPETDPPVGDTYTEPVKRGK
jgi:hypothetical protein